MKMGPSTFMTVKVEENPQGFVDKLEKIFWVIQASDVEGVSFTTYRIKDVAY